MIDSILDDVKKALGVDGQTAFDPDIIMHINSTFTTLYQLGVGPVGGFMITDSTETWDQFLGGDILLNSVKTYLYMKVRMLFDPPSTAYLVTSYEKMILEAEWRLEVLKSPVNPAITVTDPIIEIVFNGGEP